eukprot:4608297-Alexandrium_andersonii.AAC.1
MVQGQPDGRSVRPIWKHRLDLPLVQGAKSQGVKLPWNAKSNDGMPPPSQPGRTAVLVAVTGPESEGPESLH